MAAVRPSGHLQVKGEAGKRRYYALWRDADGRHQRLLGPAHVKGSRRRTPRKGCRERGRPDRPRRPLSRAGAAACEMARGPREWAGRRLGERCCGRAGARLSMLHLDADGR